MIYDDLTSFLNWWFSNGRPLNIPLDNPICDHFEIKGDKSSKKVTCINLYRHDVYQIQLIVVPANTTVRRHIHPNMDSYEVYNSGDVVFETNGILYDSNNPDSMAPIRVLPHYWHGGTFGENGASFFSVQKYLNGTIPTCAGCDWVGDDGSVIGDVTSKDKD
jgi:hypothetical protein